MKIIAVDAVTSTAVMSIVVIVDTATVLIGTCVDSCCDALFGVLFFHLVFVVFVVVAAQHNQKFDQGFRVHVLGGVVIS